jgi:hypothetical protein
MSYYDPLLQELEQLDQPNYLTQSGQAMSMRGAPIQVGGGFWSNLAAQLVPGLLGAGMSYLGQQQNRGAEADLLEAAKLQDPVAIAAKLEAGGYKGVAAKVLFAAQAQKAEEAAKLKLIQDEWENTTKKTWDLQKTDRDRDYTLKEKQINATIGANDATRYAADQSKAAQLAAAKLNAAMATEEKLNNTFDTSKAITTYEDMASGARSLIDFANKKEVTGTDMIAAGKVMSVIIRHEAVNEGDTKAINEAGGLDQYVKNKTAYYMNKGAQDPSVLQPYLGTANSMLEGKRSQAESVYNALQNRAADYSKFNEYLSPGRVGRPLSPNPIAEAMAKKEQEASKLTQGPQAVQMPKAVTAPVIPAGKKSGDTWTEGGYQYRIVGTDIQKRAIK